MQSSKEILIIGAGATGMSLALFLSDMGFKLRIIDKRQPGNISKALGINPHTLSLLESTGVTKRFQENGWKAQCMNFWCKDKLFYSNKFSRAGNKYSYVLVQAQNETEAIMEEALHDRGIYIDRGLELISIDETEGINNLQFKDHLGLIQNLDFGGIIIGADGYRSKVRECTNIKFEGWEHTEEFKLYDVELETPVNYKEGHYRLYKEGGMLMLFIRDGVWRISGNMSNLFDYLPKGTKVGKIIWESQFTIKEKIASSFNLGNSYLLGDAAHVHSPAAAKGLNLGIEDSFIFSRLLKDNKEKQYNQIRYPKINSKVGLINQLIDKLGGHNLVSDTIRNNMDVLADTFPCLMPRLQRFLIDVH